MKRISCLTAGRPGGIVRGVAAAIFLAAAATGPAQNLPSPSSAPPSSAPAAESPAGRPQPPASAPATSPPRAPQPAVTPPPSTQPRLPEASQEASESSYWIKAASDNVNLRSRADRNSVVVAQVPRDAVLKAVGSEFGWHRVIPPAGTFSYVARKYIHRDENDPQSGTVAIQSGNLRVRVGSTLTELDPDKSDLQALIPNGAPVKILGDQGEWYKIAPPEGVYLYVAGETVVKIEDEVARRLRAESPKTITAAPPAPASTQPARQPKPVAGTSDTAEEPAGNRLPNPEIPSTQPDEPINLRGPWGRRLVAVENAIAEEGRKPALDRTWDSYIAQLGPIAGQREEPAVARLADAWIFRLRQRIADRDALMAAGDVARREALSAAKYREEMRQIEQARRAAATQPGWDARGILKISYVLRGPQARQTFKIEEPITTRVVAYVEFPDELKLDVSTLLGRYVGVSGTKVFDPALGADLVRVERFTTFEPSDSQRKGQ